MKKLKLYILFGFGLLLANSCTDGLSDLNTNPDKSPNANPEQVLTSAQGYIAWVIDGTYNEDSFLWGQYWTWGPGVAIGNLERYVGEAADYNNRWVKMYAKALTDLRFVANSTSTAHAGAAKILTAYIYQGLVDHYGDVPFSEALNGELADGSNFAPKFDNDQEIYAQLVPMINDGQNDLRAGGEMHAEDLMFGGDIAAWMKFANSLKLRIMMRQSAVVDVSANVTDLIASASFIETTGDITDIAFEGSTGDENPMYAHMESGVNNFYVGSLTTMDYLAGLNDPRLESFYGESVNKGGLIGIRQGSIDEEPFTASVGDYSQMTSVCYDAANPVILMSDWEVWFLRAEAANKFNTSDDEATAFGNAIAANFTFLGTAGAADYITSLDFGAKNKADRLDQIGIQKWISMNGTQEDEGWIESRRFDVIPNTIFKKPFVGVLPDGVHPSIWLYAANEVSLNPSAPTQHTLTDKVFWDVN